VLSVVTSSGGFKNAGEVRLFAALRDLRSVADGVRLVAGNPFVGTRCYRKGGLEICTIEGF
jgi:hypothetical protein